MSKWLNIGLKFVFFINAIYFYTDFCNGQTTFNPTMSQEAKLKQNVKMQIIIKCLAKVNITFAEIKQIDQDVQDIDVGKRFLRFWKCSAEETSLVQNGVLHPENLHKFPMVPATVNPEYFRHAFHCLESIKKVVQVVHLTDMKPVMDCMQILFKDVLT